MRRPRPTRLAWLTAVVVLAAALPVAASDRVLLFTSAIRGVSSSSFALALRLQLQAYGIPLEQARWVPPRSAHEQRDAAVRRSGGYSLVAWYASEPLAAGREIRVFLSGRRAQATRFLPMGAPAAGIERAMASSLATLILATLRSAPVLPGRLLEPPATRPAPVPPPPSTLPVATRPATRPSSGTRPTSPPRARALSRAPSRPPPGVPPRAPPIEKAPRVLLDLGYGLSALPVGGELRHGPEGTLLVRPWRTLLVGAGAGLRLVPEDASSLARWTRRVVDLRLASSYEWRPWSRLGVAAGGELRVGSVLAEATRTGGGEGESATLWELALGPWLGLSLALGARLQLVMRLGVSWVAVGHELQVAGEEVARSGGVELSFGSGVRLAVW